MIPFSKQMKWFLESYIMIILTIIVVLISYYCNLTYLSLYYWSIALILFGLTKASLNCIFPFLYIFIGSWKDYKVVISSPINLAVSGSLLGVGCCCLIARLIIERKEVFKKIRNNYILLSMVGILLASIVSLINTPVMSSSLQKIGEYVIIMAFFFVGTCLFDNTKKNRHKLLVSFLLLSLTLCFQYTIELVISTISSSIFDTIISRDIIGFAMFNINTLIDYFSISIIICFFFLIHSNRILEKIVSILLMLIFVFFGFITQSRAGLATMFFIILLELAYYLIYIIKNSKSRKSNIFILGLFMVSFLSLICVIIFTGLGTSIIDRIKNSEVTNDGRIPIYKVAVECFKNHWLIGAGIGTSKYYIGVILWSDNVYYHNYLLQSLGTIGVLGTIPFLSYLFFIGKRLWKKNRYSIMVGFIFLDFLLHGFVDNMFFVCYMEPVLLIFLLLIPDGSMNRIIYESNPIEVKINNTSDIDGVSLGYSVNDDQQKCYVLCSNDNIDIVTGKVIGIIHFKNENITKWIVSGDDNYYSKKQIKKLISCFETTEFKIEM